MKTTICRKLKLNVNSDEVNFMKFLLQIRFMAWEKRGKKIYDFLNIKFM